MSMTASVRMGLAALICGILTGCAGTSNESVGSSADYPLYESVSALTGDSDAILVVEVGALASTEMDNGGDDSDGNAGVPMAFWHATVVRVLAEESGEEPGDNVVVAWPDLDKDSMQDRSRLESEQIVVLFAKRLTPIDAPGIETQDVFYVPLGGDNGVLDVDEEHATSRSEVLSRILASDEPAKGRLTVRLDHLAMAVKDIHRRAG